MLEQSYPGLTRDFLCRIGKLLSYTRKDLNNLGHVSVEEQEKF